MLEELNELIESLMIDITSEGTGTIMGVVLLWGLFFGGTFTGFSVLMTWMSSTI